MFSHERKYAVAIVGFDGAIVRFCATRLLLREAVAYLDSHKRAPSPHGQPCIMVHPILRAIRLASSKSRSA